MQRARKYIKPLLDVRGDKDMMIINSHKGGGGGIPTDGLVAYYPFNGNANDESGNGNNGIVDGATLATDRNVNSNSAYLFDGTNDIITILDNDVFSFTDGSNDKQITMSCWVYMNDATRFRLLSKRQTTGNKEWIFTITASDLLFFGCYDLTNNEISVTSTSTLTSIENEWVFLTITYDASKVSSGIKLYINASEITTTDTSVGTYTGMTNTNNGVNIGRYGVNTSDGKIDDIRIYSRVLTTEEITLLYNE